VRSQHLDELVSEGSFLVMPLLIGNVIRLNFGIEARMTQPEIGSASPLFIVRNVPQTLAFYRDRLRFEITFQGPEPDDIFFGIVQRGRAMIMFKDIGVEPVPNHSRDVGKGIARWDAYVYVPDPDALVEEFVSRGVEFFEPIKDTHDGLRGFELKDADGYILFFGRPRT
jgi:catechol 2,3-dioxygenase-like lactoylglutathione lyase family enzyme